MAARDLEPLMNSSRRPKDDDEVSQEEIDSNEDEEAGCGAHCCYMFFGCIAMWFGSELVDVDKDGDFDIHDAKLLMKLFRRGRLDNYLAKRADKDGDGDVDLLEDETDMQGLDHMKSGLKSGQQAASYADFMTKTPYFIIIQTILAFLLWFSGMLSNCIISADKVSTCPLGATNNVAGLKTFFGDWTILQFHDADCNDLRLQLWRWFTYQWSHTSFAHISMNTFMNLFLGLPLEAFNGWKRVIPMYTSGVVGGALFVALLDVHSVVIGMSGGCYALIGAKFADVFLNWGQKTFRKLELAFLIVLCIIDTLYAIFYAHSNSPAASGACHLGGLVAGWVIGLFLAKNLRLDTHEEIVRGVSVVVAILAFGAALLYLQLLGWPPSNMNSAEPGWCYIRQVTERSTFGDDHWHCVFCGDEECMAFWNSKAYVYPAQVAECAQMAAANSGLDGNADIGNWNRYGITEDAYTPV